MDCAWPPNSGCLSAPDILVRSIRSAPERKLPTPGAVGVDDRFILRRLIYGNPGGLGAQRPVEFLPDRSSATLAVWLNAHRGVEASSRDRGVRRPGGRETVCSMPPRSPIAGSPRRGLPGQAALPATKAVARPRGGGSRGGPPPGEARAAAGAPREGRLRCPDRPRGRHLADDGLHVPVEKAHPSANGTVSTAVNAPSNPGSRTCSSAGRRDSGWRRCSGGRSMPKGSAAPESTCSGSWSNCAGRDRLRPTDCARR
jgi:hypothetical protein